MRTSLAALLVVFLSIITAAPMAQAAPTQVNVRIEGKSKTLFEGPVLTVPHKVKASSDSQWRRCNGVNVNDPGNRVPAPVPTSAAADAMRIVGETFNGQWYNQYDDYFLTRWGPDEQDPGNGEYWGIVVNNVFANVGGCQYQLDGGDEVLWIYNAFAGRPRLGLYPAGYSGGAQPLTATATLGQPFQVEVDAWSGYSEGVPPASPQRSGSPFAGAEVAPVETSGQGFERVETEGTETVSTGADGKASISFDDPGWHRIKATAVDSLGRESAIRSNRLDVCVPEPPASDCGALPAEDQPRTPPPPEAGEEEDHPAEPQPEEPESAPPVNGGGQAAAGRDTGSPPAIDAGQVRLQLGRLDRSRIARGLVGVSWRVLDPGPGIERWTISSLALGRRDGRYVSRASGRNGSSVTLRLPGGGAYRLRLTVVDVLGRSATAALGKVRVPA
jgi:hypothetical protein